jgi:hypothetical protein
MLFPNPAQKIHWIDMPGSRGRPQCDRCGYAATRAEVAAMPPGNVEYVGARPLDAEADFVADAFSYGGCPRCGKGDLTLLLVPQRLFGEVVPDDL